MGRSKRILRSGTHCVPNLRNSCYLYSFCQELAKMQVRDAVIIIFGEQRSHGDNVLRIVVFDGTEIAKLPFSGCIVGYDVGSLNVDAFASWFGAYKVDFSSLQLSYMYLIAQTYEVLIDDILYHFLNVSFTYSPGNGISNAVETSNAESPTPVYVYRKHS